MKVSLKLTQRMSMFNHGEPGLPMKGRHRGEQGRRQRREELTRAHQPQGRRPLGSPGGNSARTR